MSKRPRDDRAREIERKHLGRCIDQLWGAGRRTLLELMDFPDARCQVILIKRFESRVPTRGSGEWPDLTSLSVYVPIPDEGMTWESLDKALEDYKMRTVSPPDTD